MRPTADMYRMVQARQKRKPFSLVFSRWAMAGTAIASLVALAILYAVLFRPSTLSDLPSGQAVALVGQREGFGSEKGVVVKEPSSPGKGPKKGPAVLSQLVFYFQKQDSRFVQGIDLKVPQAETITLTSADNYHLSLEPAEDCYAFIFQLTSSGILVKLFPNETHSPLQNPLQQGRVYRLPSDPNWFYLGENKGQERLYVVALAQPIQDLEDLYAQYEQADDESDEQETLSILLDRLKDIQETHPEKGVVWVFVFGHQ
jgi:hypothetical protein